MSLLDPSETSEKQKEEILKLAADVRKFEIGLFWQRSLFFWGFIAAAFIAFAQLSGKEHVDESLPFVITCFGLVCSVAWALQNRGSKYWQEAWEQKVETVEAAVLGVRLFKNREPRLEKGFWGGCEYSVSRLTIALSDFVALVWLFLAVRSFPQSALASLPDWASVAAVVTGVYVFLLVVLGTSRRS